MTSINKAFVVMATIIEQINALLKFLICAPPKMFAKFKVIREVCRSAMAILQSPLPKEARVCYFSFYKFRPWSKFLTDLRCPRKNFYSTCWPCQITFRWETRTTTSCLLRSNSWNSNKIRSTPLLLNSRFSLPAM